jgi:hypothetical protein
MAVVRSNLFLAYSSALMLSALKLVLFCLRLATPTLCAWHEETLLVIGRSLSVPFPSLYSVQERKASFVDVSINLAHVPHGSPACRTSTAMHERPPSRRALACLSQHKATRTLHIHGCATFLSCSRPHHTYTYLILPAVFLTYPNTQHYVP